MNLCGVVVMIITDFTPGVSRFGRRVEDRRDGPMAGNSYNGPLTGISKRSVEQR